MNVCVSVYSYSYIYVTIYTYIHTYIYSYSYIYIYILVVSDMMKTNCLDGPLEKQGRVMHKILIISISLTFNTSNNVIHFCGAFLIFRML